MAQDRWNDKRHGEDPQWGEARRRERERQRMSGPEDYDRYSDDRARDARAPYGPSGRYDDLSPSFRDFEASQRRIHRGDYDSAHYTPNPREGRGEEPRSWWDRAQDEVSSWLGDENARRRREWDESQAEVRAEHRGRGPKGYKRSDARIEEDLNDRLTDDRYLDASDIEVSAKDGEVTLSGLVARREDKRRAEDLAESVLGVGHVQNNLRVRPAEAARNRRDHQSLDPSLQAGPAAALRARPGRACRAGAGRS